MNIRDLRPRRFKNKEALAALYTPPERTTTEILALTPDEVYAMVWKREHPDLPVPWEVDTAPIATTVSTPTPPPSSTLVEEDFEDFLAGNPPDFTDVQL